jgi:hypothetical protein
MTSRGIGRVVHLTSSGPITAAVLHGVCTSPECRGNPGATVVAAISLGVCCATIWEVFIQEDLARFLLRFGIRWDREPDGYAVLSWLLGSIAGALCWLAMGGK